MGCGYKGYVFCRNNGWIMKNMDKGLTVPKWVLIVWPEIPQMPQNLSAQIVCLSPKVWDFDEKRFHWASLVRAFGKNLILQSIFTFWIWRFVLVSLKTVLFPDLYFSGLFRGIFCSLLQIVLCKIIPFMSWF